MNEVLYWLIGFGILAWIIIGGFIMLIVDIMSPFQTFSVFKKAILILLWPIAALALLLKGK